MFSDIDFSDFFIFIFKVNHIFIEENDQEELDGNEIDSILSFRI